MSVGKDPKLDAARAEIRDRLATLAPSLAELYDGAIHMVCDPNFPGRTRLIAHAVREICNRLPEVLGRTTSRERLDYVERVGAIEQEWSKLGLPIGGISVTEDTPSTPPQTTIPLHLYEMMAQLVADHRLVGASQAEKALGFFESLAPVDPAARESLRPAVAQWRDLTRWFVQRVHDNNEGDSSARYVGLDSKFMLLELTLASLFRGFFHSVEVLDEILEQGNPDQLDRAVANLIHPQHRRYFFDRLENPQWVEPLARRGFFKKPPDAIRDEEAGTVRFPPWPEAAYLARVAASAPEVVRDVMVAMPDTDNVYVHHDLIAAALTMPVATIDAWVQKETAWVKKQEHLFLIPQSLGKLSTHLVTGGSVDRGLTLLRVLLKVLPDTREGDKVSELLLPTPRALLDTWEYKEILKTELPALIRTVGVKALWVLVDLFYDAVLLSKRPETRGQEEDYSYIWCQDLAESQWDDRHGIRDLLLVAVREGATELLQEGVPASEVVALFQRRRQKVFRRLELLILAQRPQKCLDVVTGYLVNPDYFADGGLRSEYRILLSCAFGLLTEENRKEILGWIRKGPNIADWATNFETWTGKPATEGEIAGYRRHWEYEWLSPIFAHLPEELRQHYEALRSTVESIDASDETDDGFVEAPSPNTAETLCVMEIGDLVTLLSTWVPRRRHAIFGTSGLERELSSAVAQEPARFSSLGEAFCGTPLQYARTVLAALREAIKKGAMIEWGPSLALCRNVLARSRPTEEHLKPAQERSWERATVADFLSESFDAPNAANLPFEFRAEAWELLSSLTDDPNPTPAYEIEYGGSNMDPATLSLNTVRSQALHGVIRYALWVRRHYLKTSECTGGSDFLEEVLPEVKRVLETRLDPTMDSSVAVRAVYGQWYPWLVLLSESWARDHAAAIFADPTPQGSLARAAWVSYITFCRPYSNVAPLIYQYYEMAVESLTNAESESSTRRLREPDGCLGEHLVTLCWRKLPDSDRWDTLLERFWQVASHRLRHHALEFLGRSLCNTNEPIPERVLDWLQELWHQRSAVAKDQPEHVKELSAFGWWFSSDFLDDAWKLVQLEQVLYLGGQVDHSSRVVQKLAALANSRPAAVIRCLGLMIHGTREGWHLSAWEDSIRQSVSTAMVSEDPSVRASAVELIHDMGSKGHLSFRTLLKEVPNQ